MFSGQGTKAALDLLAQAAKPAPAPRPYVVRAPQLDIAWGSFHQGIGSSLGALLNRSPVRGKFSLDAFFKECWIERRIPKRAIAAAALWHIFFLIAPYPQFPARARHYAAFDNTELTWSGPINDLPLLDLKAAKPNPSTLNEAPKPLDTPGTEAFHPRQHILTNPVRPTHPRQTLINSAAPPEAPKILPNLPNIVQLPEFASPQRPRLQISREALEKLHPKRRRVATVAAVPLADVPSFEQKPGEIALLGSANAPARPSLGLNAGAPPRLAQKSQTGDAAPTPDIGSATSPVDGNSATFIAISATPGPPAPVVPVPQGNLAAQVAISPSGTPGANGGGGRGTGSAGGGASGNGTSKNGVDVSISGGNPPAAKGVSGLGGAARIGASSPRSLPPRPDPHAASDDASVRTGPPNFAALPEGAKPEQIFASKKIYKLQIDMPNLNSATGSWILNFTELRTSSDTPRVPSADLNGPAPIRKVDPKYPPTLINEHVEGEVILYAVIHRDGSVDSIQLVRGIDDQLDANAMNALSQWRFRAGTRNGVPIELEAIVHIPFRAPDVR